MKNTKLLPLQEYVTKINTANQMRNFKEISNINLYYEISDSGLSLLCMDMYGSLPVWIASHWNAVSISTKNNTNCC